VYEGLEVGAGESRPACVYCFLFFISIGEVARPVDWRDHVHDGVSKYDSVGQLQYGVCITFVVPAVGPGVSGLGCFLLAAVTLESIKLSASHPPTSQAISVRPS